MSIMKSNQHLQQINSTIFFWIPDIGCKNRGDEDSKIPTHLSKQSIPHRLFKLKTVGKLGETQLLWGFWSSQEHTGGLGRESASMSGLDF